MDARRGRAYGRPCRRFRRGRCRCRCRWRRPGASSGRATTAAVRVRASGRRAGAAQAYQRANVVDDASGPSAAMAARCASVVAWLPPVKATTRMPAALAAAYPGRAVLDDQAGGGSIAEAFGGEKEEIGGGLAARDHGGGEGAPRESGARGRRRSARARSARAATRRRRSKARQRVEGLGDAGDGPEFGAEGGVEAAAHLGEGGVGRARPKSLGEDLAGRGERAAEEAGVRLFRVESRGRPRRGSRGGGGARSARYRRARRRSRR